MPEILALDKVACILLWLIPPLEQAVNAALSCRIWKDYTTQAHPAGKPWNEGV